MQRLVRRLKLKVGVAGTLPTIQRHVFGPPCDLL